MIRLFLLILLQIVLSNSSYATTISEVDNFYLVKNVTVEGASFKNKQSTKQIAISQAKQVALNDLIKYTKSKNISIDETNIDSAISAYKIINEYYDENFYTLIADFTFDKSIFKLLSNNDNKDTDEKIDCTISIREKDDIISEYSKLKNFFKAQKIDFLVREINSKNVSFFLKNVNKKQIFNSLKKMNLNGKLYIEN